MFKTLMTSLFAVSLFAAGIAGSLYLTEIRKGLLKETDEFQPALAALPESPEQDEPVLPKYPSIDAAHAELPTPFHGPAMSAADVFRYASMNRKTMESLKLKEEAIRQEEMRLNLLTKDVEGRKREVEGLLQQTQNAVAHVEQLRAQLALETQEWERKKAEQKTDEAEETASGVPSPERLANIKVTADWLAGMQPNDAAETLKNLANSGKMEFALRLLSFIEARKVAVILDSMQDPTLVAEMTEGFLDLTRPPKPKKR